MSLQSRAEAFWANVSPTGFCWLWTGGTTNGYGRFIVSGQRRQAHRVAYELLVGSIPDGLHLDHLCRTKRCVNPDHLEPVTLEENVRRAWLAKGRGWDPGETADEKCGNGHWLTAANTYLRPDRQARVCRRCKDEQCRRRRERLRAS